MANRKNTRREFIPDIIFSDARISGRSNFAGAERTHNGRVVNSEGNRNFCVNIPDDGVMYKRSDGSTGYFTAEELIEQGWNVKIHAGSEADAPSYYLPIKVNFGFRPPVMWTVTRSEYGDKRNAVTEDNVDLLDGRAFSRINLIVHPSVRQDWDSGTVTVTAYLNEGWFYITASPFESEWQNSHPEELEQA